MAERAYRIDDGTKVGERLIVLHLSKEGALLFADSTLAIKSKAWTDHFGGHEITAARLRKYFAATPPNLARERHLAHKHYRANGRISLGRLTKSGLEDVAFVKHKPVYGLMGKIARRLGAQPMPEKAYIVDIDVKPDSQKRGIGSAVLHAALGRYPSDAEVILEAVGNEQDHAHEWFESLGLSEDPTTPLKPLDRNGVVLNQTRYGGALVAEVMYKLGSRVQLSDL